MQYQFSSMLSNFQNMHFWTSGNYFSEIYSEKKKPPWMTEAGRGKSLKELSAESVQWPITHVWPLLTARYSLPSLTWAKLRFLLLQGSLIMLLSWLFLWAESCSVLNHHAVAYPDTRWHEVSKYMIKFLHIRQLPVKVITWKLAADFPQEDDQPLMQLLIWGYKSNRRSPSLPASATNGVAECSILMPAPGV